MNRTDKKANQHLQYLLCWSLIVSLTAFAIYRFCAATTWGIGLFPDSLQYLSGAKDIINNSRLTGLSSNWPPLYPLSIALTGYFSDNLLTSTKWLHVVIYAANIAVFSYIIYRHSNHSLLAPLVGTLILTTSAPFMQVHAIALSEPLYCFLSLSGVFFLADHLCNYNPRTLVLSALLLGLACVTRYAGISLLLGGFIAILLLSTERMKTRLLSCLFFVLIGATPLLIWLTGNLITGKSAASRDLVFHPISWEKIHGGLGVLLDWLFISDKYGYLLIILLIGIVLLYFILTQLDSCEFPGKIIFEICFIFILVYLAFLFFSISLFDAHTPLDDRILVPVYLLFFLPISIMLSAAINNKQAKIAGLVILIGLLILSWKQFDKQTNFIVHSELNGLGFAGKKWVQSKTLLWLKNYDNQVIVHTNVPEAIQLYTDKEATLLPAHTFPTTQTINPDFEIQIDQLNNDLQSGRAIIAYFKSVSWRWYLPSIKQLDETMLYTTIFNSNDGIVLTTKNRDSDKRLD